MLIRKLCAGLLALAALLPLSTARADENVPDRTHAADRQSVLDNALDPFSMFNQVIYGFETAGETGSAATPGESGGSAKSKLNLPNTKSFHGTTYFLVFRDEFNGTSIDGKQWITLSGQRKGGYWDTNAVYVGNGCLVLKTFKDSIGYKSGAINSKGAFQATYGYFEVRMKFQTQQGHWPAFWLFNEKIITNTQANGGKDGAEIDIVEKGFLGDRLQHALHWDGYLSNHKTIYTAIP
jgi:beta-glucanase (GH16 family)